MTHTKARRHEVKNRKEESFESFVPSWLRVRFLLISAQTQKLAALKTHKKGLMQQLFPSPEELS